MESNPMKPKEGEPSPVIKSWGDRTAGESHFEGLVLESDRKWTTVTIEAKGTGRKQNFEIRLLKNGAQTLFAMNISLSQGERESWSIAVNDTCSLSVSGKLSVNFFPPAEGSVTLSGFYEENLFVPVTATWSDSTIGKSFIERLELPADHRWDHATLLCTGKKDKITGVSLALIADGALSGYPNHGSWNVLTGTDGISREFKIGKKTALSVAGYITNRGTGGGAEIRLTAYYRKGE